MISKILQIDSKIKSVTILANNGKRYIYLRDGE